MGPFSQVLTSQDGTTLAAVDFNSHSVMLYDTEYLLQDLEWRPALEPLSDLQHAQEVLDFARYLSSYAFVNHVPEMAEHFRERTAQIAEKLKLDWQAPDKVENPFKYLVDQRTTLGDVFETKYGAAQKALFHLGVDAGVLTEYYEPGNADKLKTFKTLLQEDRKPLRLPETVVQYAIQAAVEEKPKSEVRAQLQTTANQLSDYLHAGEDVSERERRFEEAAYYHEMAILLGIKEDRLADSLTFHWRAITTLEPLGVHSAEMWFQLARSYHLLGHHVQAQLAYQRALTIDPAHRKSLQEFAILLGTCPNEMIRDGEAATKVAQQLSELMKQQNIPETERSIYAQLVAAAANGDFESAIKHQVRLYEVAAPQLPNREELAAERFKERKPVLFPAEQASALTKSVESISYPAECWHLYDRISVAIGREAANLQPTLFHEAEQIAERLDLDLEPLPKNGAEVNLTDYLNRVRSSLRDQIVRKHGQAAAELFEMNFLLHLIELNYSPKNEKFVKAMPVMIDRAFKQVKFPDEELSLLKKQMSEAASEFDVQDAIREFRRAMNRDLPLVSVLPEMERPLADAYYPL